MKTLYEQLNFSTNQKDAPERAVKINPKKDIAYYDTLCLYCANNDVDLSKISDDDFLNAADCIKDYGSACTEREVFYFWID